MESQQYGQWEEHEGRPRESRRVRKMERMTARLPSDLFLWGAGAAMAASLVTQIMGGRGRGSRFTATERAPLPMFIGMWVPSLLLLGVYNKIVKVAGSDRYSD